MIVKYINVGTLLEDPEKSDVFVKGINLDADTNRVTIKPSRGKLIVADLDEDLPTYGTIYDLE